MEKIKLLPCMHCGQKPEVETQKRLPNHPDCCKKKWCIIGCPDSFLMREMGTICFQNHVMDWGKFNARNRNDGEE